MSIRLCQKGERKSSSFFPESTCAHTHSHTLVHTTIMIIIIRLGWRKNVGIGNFLSFDIFFLLLEIDFFF